LGSGVRAISQAQQHSWLGARVRRYTVQHHLWDHGQLQRAHPRPVQRRATGAENPRRRSVPRRVRCVRDRHLGQGHGLMRLDRPFVRLPLLADATRLAEEITAIDEDAWRDHPEGAPGNTALPIVAAGGNPEDNSTKGPMAPTPALARLPYTRQVLAGLGATIGRTRFMRIAHETELHAHVDTNYYWWNHLRVHVPIVTTPGVLFEVGGEAVHMGPGELWVFDTWRRHRVDNPAAAPRIHLVIDTVGGAELWDLIEDPDRAPRMIEFVSDAAPLLPLETVNHPVVMCPSEVDATLAALLAELATVDGDAAARLAPTFASLRHAWRDLFARFGVAQQGWPLYEELLRRADAELTRFGDGPALPNGIACAQAFRQLVITPALNPELAGSPAGTSIVPSRVRPPASSPSAGHEDVVRARLAGPPRISRPIFVVSPPRSGSTLLFETLARAPGLFTIGGESHGLFEGVASLRPDAHAWSSNRLLGADASEGVVAHLKDAFVTRLRDHAGNRPSGGPTRMLEKTPKNALRVPFLVSAFPDACFVYLYRDPRETISSMLDAWRSGRFVTYADLPGWGGNPWSLLLTPGWEALDGRPLAEVVTEQWATTTTVLLDDLEALEPDRWCVASYDRLVKDPLTEITQLCSFLGTEWDDELAEPLPESRHTLDSPHPEKWRRNAEELKPYEPRIQEVAQRALRVFAVAPRVEAVVLPPSADREVAGHRESVAVASESVAPRTEAGEVAAAVARVGPTDPELFSSRHTAGFGALLRQFGASLAITTYQAGRLILVRPGSVGLNTHFRSMPMPMGIAFDGRRLALGTKSEIVVFQNQPALAGRLDPPDRHDACFVTRHRHSTGDIRVHDLAWADDGLWVVNTRFSCLATLDDEHSFVPRWRPPFVSALAPEDRCHLNGLAVVDGRPRYVTVLGITDEANGWREHKATGGALIDVESGETIAGGLSMPHSPRWHDGRLWLLESGLGALCRVDLDTGVVEQMATVPGFARGLAFVGKYAIVGLSRVREHAFDGLPLTRGRTEDLQCGVWVVDTTTGETAAHLAFEGLVQEIFEVSLLTGMRYPELVEPGAPLADAAYVLPTPALDDVPAEVRG